MHAHFICQLLLRNALRLGQLRALIIIDACNEDQLSFGVCVCVCIASRQWDNGCGCCEMQQTDAFLFREISKNQMAHSAVHGAFGVVVFFFIMITDNFGSFCFNMRASLAGVKHTMISDYVCLIICVWHGIVLRLAGTIQS